MKNSNSTWDLINKIGRETVLFLILIIVSCDSKITTTTNNNLIADTVLRNKLKEVVNNQHHYDARNILNALINNDTVSLDRFFEQQIALRRYHDSTTTERMKEFQRSFDLRNTNTTHSEIVRLTVNEGYTGSILEVELEHDLATDLSNVKSKRLQLVKTENGIIDMKEVSVAKTKTLTKQDWDTLITKLNAADYWHLTDSNEEELHGTFWKLQSITKDYRYKNNVYHSVSRPVLHDGCFKEACMYIKHLLTEF